MVFANVQRVSICISLNVNPGSSPIMYYVEIGYPVSSTIGAYIDATFWDVTPVDSRNPHLGYTLSLNGQYISTKSVMTPYSGVHLVPTTDRSNAAIVVPIDKGDAYSIALVNDPNSILTLRTDGARVVFEAPNGGDSFPSFQRFLKLGLVPDNRAYFWLQNASGAVLAISGTASGASVVTTTNQTVEDTQLWTLVGSSVISKCNGFSLNISGSPDSPATLVTGVRNYPPSPTESWTLADSGFLSIQGHSAAVDSSTNPVSLAVAVPGKPQQSWTIVDYTSTPDTSEDPLATLPNGTRICIQSVVDDSAITIAANTTVLQPYDETAASQVLVYESGCLQASADATIVLTSSAGVLMVVNKATPTAPNQQWKMTASGALVDGNGAVLYATPPSIVVRSFNPVQPPAQCWYVSVID